MMDSTVLAAVSLLSGVFATLFFIRTKIEEHAKAMSAHFVEDSKFQTLIVDRLARIETKLDTSLGRNP